MPMLVQLPVQFLKSKRKIKIHTPRRLIRDVSAGFLFFIEEIMKPYHDALRMHNIYVYISYHIYIYDIYHMRSVCCVFNFFTYVFKILRFSCMIIRI